MANLGDISKINLPNGNVVNIKDATARSNVVLLETMNGQKNLLYVPSSVTVTDDYAGTPIVFASDSDGYVTASPQSDSRYFQYTSSQYKIDLSAGDYVLYADIKTTVNSANFKAVLLNTSNASIVELPMRNKTGVTTTAFTIATTGSYGLLAKLLGGSSRFMILKKSIWDAGFTDYQPYALPNTKITPELIELVDSGAKNLFQISDDAYQSDLNGLTATFNADGSVTVTGTMTNTTKAAVVYLSPSRTMDYRAFQGCVLSGGLSENERIILQNSVSPYNSIAFSQGTGVEITNTIPEKTVLYIYITKRSTAVNYTFYPMVCSKAAWDVSQKFVPYRPTYEETVEQVAENENNISSLIDSTVKNLADIPDVTATSGAGYYGDTSLNISEGEYTFYAVVTVTGAIGFAVTIDGAEQSFLLPQQTYTNYVYTRNFTAQTGVTRCRSYLSNNGDKVENFMICKKSDYTASPTYQPYAMSNAEITAWIKSHT